MPPASDNTAQLDDPKEAGVHNDDDDGGYVIEKMSKDTTYLQVFSMNDDVHIRFTGNVTLV